MSENNKRWISRLRNGLGKSSNRLVDGISSIFSDRPIDAKTLEELEDLLISACLLYTSPSPRDGLLSRMPSSA